MKTFYAGMLVLLLMFSLCGCGNNANTEAYNKACGLFLEGEYMEARAIFETLGDYNDGIKMAEKCIQKEIENQLQGCWDITMSGTKTNIVLEFKNGEFDFSLRNDENEKITNDEYGLLSSSGTYWIDFETQTIYTCAEGNDDTPISVEMTISNTYTHGSISRIVGYSKYCTYTYENETLTLYPIDHTSEAAIIKQATNEK